MPIISFHMHEMSWSLTALCDEPLSTLEEIAISGLAHQTRFYHLSCLPQLKLWQRYRRIIISSSYRIIAPCCARNINSRVSIFLLLLAKEMAEMRCV
ncbi:hypothetical protein NS226_08350 [Aureimonas ureilytica]|uniref:Uncharacterized protein n=1 Tax=Aureimonas ureilytica TaxID=401562 RepID=A0A175R9X0_9HYPH|nr:hypothetical protein NS226_08350 [Aureimonas ureilytica]